MKKTHSNVCPVEIAGALDSRLRRLVQNPEKILKNYLHPGDKVLELGCGPGFFTIDIARLVGESGLVYAADLQEGMLELVRKKVALANMQNRIMVHKCEESAINLNDTVDFVFAFYMIHELADKEKTFMELKKILKPDGRLLIVEPDFHVTKTDFQDMISRLVNTGFKVTGRQKLFFSRSVLLQIDN